MTAVAINFSAPVTVAPTPAAATRRARKRLLLVAYCFPPVGGAGVQRPVKWVKYLHELGWDVSVLTPSNPSVPVLDESLLADIPESTTIVRCKTYEPSYETKQALAGGGPVRASFKNRLLSPVTNVAKWAAKKVLQPDPQVLWVPSAIQAGRKLLEAVRHDAILCTAPPYSSFLVGRSLKRRFHLPLVLDYRDEWDLSSKYLENAHRDLWSNWVQDRLQQSVLKSADAVIATTIASAGAIQTRLDRAGHAVPATCIYNGFDPDDFKAVETPGSAERVTTLPERPLRIVYTGTLWNLTTLLPFAAAVEQLAAENPELPRQIEFVCLGRRTPEQNEIVERCRAMGVQLVLKDYCEHSRVVAWQRSADALLLLLSDAPGAERIVSGKLFEYLAVRRDILSIIPAGEMSEILSRFLPDGTFAPKDTQGIAGWLRARLNRSEAPAQLPDADSYAEFSRPAQAAQVAELLNGLTERMGKRASERGTFIR